MAERRRDRGGQPDGEPGDGLRPSEERAARRRARREEREQVRDDVGATTAPAPEERTPELGRRGAAQFVRECLIELRRVQWPNREQLWSATAVVLIMCIVVGTYLAALDSVFTRAARWLIDQQAG